MILQLFAINDDKLTNFTFNHADQVDEYGKATGDFTVVQTNFDSRAEELRLKHNALIDSLIAITGSGQIGAKKLSDGVSLSDIQTELEYLLAELQGVVLGQIPDGTVTDAKLATDNKVGSLALLDTVNKVNVVSAINELQAEIVGNFNTLNILKIAELDTGVADAYVVNTSGTFNRVDGNILNFIPNNNNTGASTIDEDDNGVAPIQKYVEGAWIALEEGDLKKFQQVQLVWNASESAFQLAPKGGATTKSIQRGSLIMTSGQTQIDVGITTVDETSTIEDVNSSTSNSAFNSSHVSVRGKLISGSVIRFNRYNADTSRDAIVTYEIIEYVSCNVQRGEEVFNALVAGNQTIPITLSAVNTTKTITKTSEANENTSGMRSYAHELTTTTNINQYSSVGSIGNDITVAWVVGEF